MTPFFCSYSCLGINGLGKHNPKAAVSIDVIHALGSASNPVRTLASAVLK
jgi:hypothetical protein